MTLYDLIVLVFWKILSVTLSGAGPPLETLYLIPKSLSGPPGLCEAVRRMPPYALYLRMTLEAAGVERMAFWPTMNLETPLAEPIFRMVWTVSGEKNRPSPPMTSVVPLGSIESKIAWMKFSV